MKNLMIRLCVPVFVLFAASHVTMAADSDKAIRDALAQILPNFEINTISPSPMAGISEVQVGSRLFYVSNDGKYLFQGSLIDIKTRTDLSEERRKSIRAAAINDIGEDNMIIFPAKDAKHTVTVFTDVDCTYCRKLHREMDQYNSRGITVRYLMYPRSGIDTPSYYKAVAVWCEDDHQAALTRAKAGEQLTAGKQCDNPIKEHMKLGETMGLRGTPAIILSDGEMLPGYIPAEKLAIALDTKPKL